MGETTADLSCERQCLKRTLRVGLAMAGFIVCAVASGRPASVPIKGGRWMQSIERPPLSRGWDYDGKRILGHVGEKLLLWDATTGKLLHKMQAHKEKIFVVQFSPDGVHALSSSWMGSGGMAMYKSKDTRTIVWNLATGADTTMFHGQVAGEFSPDGKRIVTFCARRDNLDLFDAAVWDAFSGRRIAEAKLGMYGSPLWTALHFSPDGLGFAHVNLLEAVLYDAADGHEIGRAADRFGNGHRYTSEGAFASFGLKGTTLTDIKSGRVVRRMAQGLKEKGRIAWTHDGKRFATIPYDAEIKIWDVASGRMTTGAKCGPFPHNFALVSPDNSRLAVEWGGANDVEPGLGLYDMNSGKEIARIKLAEWGHIVGFSPDSKTILIGGTEFVIYESESGKRIRSLKLLDDVSFEYNWNR